LAFEKPSRQLLPPHGERPGSLALRHQGTEATEGRVRPVRLARAPTPDRAACRPGGGGPGGDPSRSRCRSARARRDSDCAIEPSVCYGFGSKLPKQQNNHRAGASLAAEVHLSSVTFALPRTSPFGSRSRSLLEPFILRLHTEIELLGQIAEITNAPNESVSADEVANRTGRFQPRAGRRERGRH